MENPDVKQKDFINQLKEAHNDKFCGVSSISLSFFSDIFLTSPDCMIELGTIHAYFYHILAARKGGLATVWREL